MCGDHPDRPIGHARVSTDDKNLDLQRDAAAGAGRGRIFEEKEPGRTGTKRPAFEAALAIPRPEDQFVVWKVDRLGRSFARDAGRRPQAAGAPRQAPVADSGHEIARRRDEPRRKRVTIALEEDVLRFYRSMARNYAGRINEVLRAYMHARLAGLLQGAETVAAERPAAPPPEPPVRAAVADPAEASRETRMGAYLAAYAKVAGPEGEEIVRRILGE